MKKIICLFCAIFFIGFSSIVFSEMKIGYVDLNKILTEAPQIKALRTALDKTFDMRGQSIINSQKSFLEEIKNYNNNPQPVNLSALTPEQQKISDEYKVLQEARTNFQRDVATAYDQAMVVILSQIADIVSNIAQQQKFNLVMTKRILAYNVPQFDLTEQVITELKKK